MYIKVIVGNRPEMFLNVPKYSSKKKVTLFSVHHISLTPHHNRHFISTRTDNFQQKYASNTKKIIISVNAVRNDTSIPRGGAMAVGDNEEVHQWERNDSAPHRRWH